MGVETVQHYEQTRVPCLRWHTPSPQPKGTVQKPGSKAKTSNPDAFKAFQVFPILVLVELSYKFLVEGPIF